MLSQKRPSIVGGASIHKNREDRNYGGLRIRPTICRSIDNHRCNKSPVNNRISKSIGKFYKDEVICDLDDMKDCHIRLGKSWHCKVQASYDLKRNLYLFLWKERELRLFDPKTSANLPRKKVRREKMFEVDEALNIENSAASSFEVRGNEEEKIEELAEEYMEHMERGKEARKRKTIKYLGVAEQLGKILIPEDCIARQFNRSAGKVCILTDHLEFIMDTMKIPIENEIIIVRVSKVEGEIDTLFNGYVLDSSSDDDGYSSADENNEDDGGRTSKPPSEEPMSMRVLREMCGQINYPPIVRSSPKDAKRKEPERPNSERGVKARLIYAKSPEIKIEAVGRISLTPESKTPTAERTRRRHAEAEGGVFNRLGRNEPATSARPDSRQRSPQAKRTEVEARRRQQKGTESKTPYEDDLSQPWTCEERNPFTPRIRHSSLPMTRMPSHIKIYDGSGDPEDHLKLFQSAAKIEGWALPTSVTWKLLQQTKQSRIGWMIHTSSKETEISTEDHGKDIKQNEKQIDEMIKAGKLVDTQSFSPETAMSFPPLREEDGTEGPMIIEVEMGGHYCATRDITLPVVASSEVLERRRRHLGPLGQIGLASKSRCLKYTTPLRRSNFMVYRTPTNMTAPRVLEEIILYTWLHTKKKHSGGLELTDRSREGIRQFILYAHFRAEMQRDSYGKIGVSLAQCKQTVEKILPSTHDRCRNKSTDKATVVKFGNIRKNDEMDSSRVLVEELKKNSINEKEILDVVEEESNTWMTPICEYLAKEILPEDKKKARAISFGMNGKEKDVAKIIVKGDLVGLQETMSSRVDRHLVRGIWGNNSFEFESKNSIGKSGGDFNEVRSNVERKASIFCQKGANLFNDFIASSSLFDLPLYGMRYTHLRRKAKTRWTLEGDENSGFFHGIINSNRNRSRINGLNFHGSWTTDPTALKSHIFQVYSSKFKEDVISRPTFSSDNFKKLSSDDLLILDYPISDQEIKDAVWDCESEKAPGPDGFTFKFYKSQWDTIVPDVIAYIREFEMTSFLPRGCNSSFIALVQKILANRLAMVIPLVVSEAQTAFIKGRQIIDGPLMVDEIISWAKTPIMDSTGFTSKWRQWIFACLNSGYASVLVNCSPTLEFKIERGLRHGGPLSPLLFILAIEALNVVIFEAKNRSLFRGVEVGKDKINVSHFQFADDALILGEWSFLNAPKSIINKLESIRRNFFWGGSLDSQKISWIAWKKVISPLKCGGLGIDSLSSSNISLLSKWWWMLYNESDSLWGRVIRSIHGPQGGLLDTSIIKSNSGPWHNIALLRDDLTIGGHSDLPSSF
ncbi:putative RNA-directed DNA polymerase, eukaryota, reverse transcriptase zinc-binding domain protein [Tanacetum coccineum]